MQRTSFSICTECRKFRPIHHVVKISPKSNKVLQRLCLGCFDKVFVEA